MKIGLGFGPCHKGAAAQPAFSPLDISGLALWHDASDAASITQVAGAVSAGLDERPVRGIADRHGVDEVRRQVHQVRRPLVDVGPGVRRGAHHEGSARHE